jgi:16S rRNA G527 N7-methylase RsmG
MKKAAFLANVLADFAPGSGRVVERQVQRAADLAGVEGIRVITARGIGGWFRLLPKLAPVLGAEGVVLLWAGQDVAAVRRREAWKRLRLLETRPLPGAERTAVWMFGAAETLPSATR